MKNWMLIGIAVLLIVAFTFGWSKYSNIEKNNVILRANQEYYKKQIEDYHKREDSLKNIIVVNNTEIDSLKSGIPIILIEKSKAKKQVALLLNSQMQEWYDDKVKQLMNK